MAAAMESMDVEEVVLNKVQRSRGVHSEKYGIRSRFFLLFAVLVILPFLTIAILAGTVFRNSVVDNYGSNMADTMAAVSQQVKTLMTKYEEATMNLYYGGTVGLLPGTEKRDSVQDKRTESTRTAVVLSEEEKEERIIESMEAICYSNSDVMSAYLLSGGKIYSAGLQNSVDIRKVVETHEEAVSAAGGRARWFRADALFGKWKSQRYLLVREVNDTDLVSVGTLCLVLNEKLFSKPFKGLNVNGLERYVLDGEGKIFYSVNQEEIGKEFPAKDLVMDRQKIYGSSRIEGQDVIYASCALYSPELYFVSICPVSNILKPMEGLRAATILICVIYLTFVFAMLFLLNHYIFHPISLLSQKMDAFAQGDLHIKMEQSSIGEVRSLGQHFNQMTEKINDLVVTNERNLKEKNQLEARALTAQIKPHFIYNALNTIKWMAVINRQDNISKMVEALVGILMNAAQIEDENYTLKEEITLIENYARIQKARFMNFELEFELDLEPERFRIRKFLLQPVVENAITHGFSRGKRRGRIHIHIWEDGQLRIRVQDNGIGFDVESWRRGEEKQEDHTNIGLHNIEQLIRLEYGEEYGMEIESQAGRGTTVEYRLPLLKCSAEEKKTEIL